MEFPTDIPHLINPEIQDPVSKSVIYTFSTQDFLLDGEGNILYKFPYSKDTYWTNFTYSCYNITKNQPEELEIGIKLVTSDDYEYCVQMIHTRQAKVWYDTEWPFPSINTIGTSAGVYFKIKQPSDNESKYMIQVKLLGFMDLFPKVENYLLLSTLDTYQFVFAKYEMDDLPSRGVIYNVENYDYIREIIVKACGVRLIKRY